MYVYIYTHVYLHVCIYYFRKTFFAEWYVYIHSCFSQSHVQTAHLFFTKVHWFSIWFWTVWTILLPGVPSWDCNPDISLGVVLLGVIFLWYRHFWTHHIFNPTFWRHLVNPNGGWDREVLCKIRETLRLGSDGISIYRSSMGERKAAAASLITSFKSSEIICWFWHILQVNHTVNLQFWQVNHGKPPFGFQIVVLEWKRSCIEQLLCLTCSMW